MQPKKIKCLVVQPGSLRLQQGFEFYDNALHEHLLFPDRTDQRM